MTWLSTWLQRRCALVATAGFLLAIFGGAMAARLYLDLQPDLQELLPASARSVHDLREAARRFRSIDNLTVLVRTDDTRAGRRFVDALAGRLEGDPLVARVEFKIDRELRFFGERQALYLDLADLRRLERYVEERIYYEREIRNPLNIFSGRTLEEPKLDMPRIRKRYQDQLGAYTRFPGGYFATPDEKWHALIVSLSGENSAGRATRLKALVEARASELRSRALAPDLEVRYTGEVESILEEEAALTADLELSGAIVTILVTAAMLLFFRAARATLALVASLLMGTAWTLGAAYFLIGHLNANTAFLGSIVLGNGINFGIILLARYLEERRRGIAHSEALPVSMRQSAPATLVAALAAGLSYGSLILTDFRGFSQFGVVGLVGMGLCWLASYSVLPALLTLAERRAPLAARSRPRIVNARFARWLARRSGPILAVSAVLTVVSLALIAARAGPELIESDLSRVRSRASFEHGSGYYARVSDAIFGRYLVPVAILGSSRKDAREVAARLREARREKGSGIAMVRTIEDFLPIQQEEKIAVLLNIRSMLRPALIRELSPSDQAQVKRLLTPAAFIPVRPEDLPPVILGAFREKDGTIGRVVLVEPELREGPMPRLELFRFVGKLREAAGPDPVAGSLPISADILTSIERDGPGATALAFAAVTALVLILFRNVKIAFRVLTALLLGVVWLGGAITSAHIRINFLNFVALPITFGIGVDYGVNIFQRWREGGDLTRVLRNTGGAVALCSLTTIIGYGSLLIAQNRALQSFGLLAVLGEICCLSAALFSLPAYLIVRSKKAPEQAQERKAA